MLKNENLHPLETEAPEKDEDYLYSGSNHDCTGLTPTPAHNEFEAESYQELYHYLPPVHPENSISVGDAPLPPYNHGRTTDDIHLETRHHEHDQRPTSRYDYP